MLNEIVQAAHAEVAREGGDASNVTLLRVLGAYEMVLQRHHIVAIEDTVCRPYRPPRAAARDAPPRATRRRARRAAAFCVLPRVAHRRAPCVVA